MQKSKQPPEEENIYIQAVSTGFLPNDEIIYRID